MKGTLTGIIENVVVKNGWFEATINGEKYSTKKDAVGAEVIKLQGQAVEVEYTSTTREKDGRVYTNHYIDAVRPGDIDDSPPSGHHSAEIGRATAPAPATAGDAREMRILRQTATKVAVQELAHLQEGERNHTNLILLAENLVDYYLNGAK